MLRPQFSIFSARGLKLSLFLSNDEVETVQAAVAISAAKRTPLVNRSPIAGAATRTTAQVLESLYSGDRDTFQATVRATIKNPIPEETLRRRKTGAINPFRNVGKIPVANVMLNGRSQRKKTAATAPPAKMAKRPRSFEAPVPVVGVAPTISGPEGETVANTGA